MIGMGITAAARIRGARLALALSQAMGIALIVSCGFVNPPIAVGATGTSPSAIGDVAPLSIAVSPDYLRSGLVGVVASRGDGCSSNCGELWLTHDRGGTWTRVDRAGFSGSHLVIAVDAGGHPIFYALTTSGIERSTDLGSTWIGVGAEGIGTASPGFAQDATIAVAAKSDYLLRGTRSQPVAGSSGTMTDADWAIPAGFPATGANAPVLLGGLNGAIPTVERCTTQFSCYGPVALPATDNLAGPPILATSSTYPRDGTVFAQTAEGVFKSTNGGATFTPLVLPTAGASHVGVAMLSLSPTYSERGPDRHVYVAALMIYGTGKSMVQGGAVFASSDGGATWSSLGSPSPLDGGAIAVAATPDGRLFAGYFANYGAGLLCNPDGTTWRAACASASRSPAGSGAATGPQHTQPQSCAGGACSTASPTSGLAAAGGSPRESGARSAVGQGPTASAPAGRGDGVWGWMAALGAAAVLVLGARGVVLARRRLVAKPDEVESPNGFGLRGDGSRRD